MGDEWDTGFEAQPQSTDMNNNEVIILISGNLWLNHFKY